jgi:hypothetical protein
VTVRVNAHVAQLVELTLGKGEVSSSNLLMSSRYMAGKAKVNKKVYI